ncbi:hypothetical protein [Halostreptopolyspora alba]|uniref:DUF3558 domain-containing protein n=1 Tax=Halostreptopolyspora alba TaxID=2487137 RepID=A0A3N0E5A1_9ACTN|nr:hypothetical protein EFW17_17640 [Nocardiopsaceae bacterium YIM 96095]
MSGNHTPEPNGSQDPTASPSGDGASPGRPGSPATTPDRPRHRRTGALIGGVAGGAAALCVAAVAVATSTGGEEPYASVGSCEELLTEDTLAGVDGMAGAEVEEERDSPDPSEDGEVVESLECAAVNDETESAMFLTLTRFDPETAGEDYAAVRTDRERSIAEFAESYGADLDNADGDSGVTAEEVSYGDGGHAYSIEGTGGESIGVPRTSTVIYSTRNLNVHVMYQGGEDLSAEDHMGMATDTGASVDERLAETAEVE